MEIILSHIDDIKEFEKIASNCAAPIDAQCGRYVIDAKSIMGLLSLDLTRAIKVEVRTDDNNIKNEFYDQIKIFYKGGCQIDRMIATVHEASTTLDNLLADTLLLAVDDNDNEYLLEKIVKRSRGGDDDYSWCYAIKLKKLNTMGYIKR